MGTELHRERRARLAQLLGPGAALILASPPERTRNGDVTFKFRQDSDILYLTGFEEPGTMVVLRPDHPQTPFVMFVRPRNPADEIWTGRRAGIEGAMRSFGAYAAYPIEEADQRLPDLISGTTEVHYHFGRETELDERLLRIMGRLRAAERRGKRAPVRLVDARLSVHEMRLFKSPAELDIQRRAADITSLEHSAALQAGQLLLVDAGGEVEGFTADVTRTFPVGGQFTPPQRRVYEAVLETQIAAIEAVKPGITLEAIHEQVVATLTRKLVELGILQGDPAALVAAGGFKPYYMHRTSHWLGMDVHDVGFYSIEGAARPLEPGMVLTIEPGLYIAEDAPAPPEYRGIGVRIEDDIVVTATGYDNLTSKTPKGVAELEELT